ncbi:MAG: cadherin-like domain-containing protein, partial [Planctomycetota bacterium]
SNTNGVYEVRIRVSDGQLWSEQLVQVTVADENDQPVVISDNWSMDEDTTLNQSVLANDSDQDADPLTVELLEGPENAANFALNSDGTFNYRPAENWYGTDGFRYRISDGRGGTSEGNVTLQVQPVNDAPISLENVFTVLQGSTLETATGVLNNDMDIESEPLIAILVAPPTRGVITFRVDGSFLYKPEIGFIGTDNFTYIASDGVMAGTPTTVWVQVDVGSGLPSTPPPPPAPFGDSGNSGGNSSGDSGSSSGDSSSGSGNSDTGNSDSSSNNDSSGGDNSNTNTAGTDSTDATPQAGQTQTGTTGVSGDDEQLAAGSEDRQLEGGSAIRLEDLQADVLTGEERLIGSFRIRDFIAAQTAIGDGEEVDTSRIEVNGKMIEVSFNRRQLWEQLAYLQRQVEEKRSLQSDSSLGEIALEIGTATMAASLGYVLWFLRGSAMMATAITQIPSWKMIDPLVILDSRNTTQDSTYEDQDIINSYFENASND